MGQAMFDRDFKEFIESLNENKVDYLVVGGYAVAFHGHPRYTKDMDVWVRRDRGNAERLVQALNDFGFGDLGLSVEDFMEPESVVQLGYPPNRIDLLSDLKGVDFDRCYLSKIEVDIEGVSVNFVDLENLKKNKEATGRHQDLADLEQLG